MVTGTEVGVWISPKRLGGNGDASEAQYEGDGG